MKLEQKVRIYNRLVAGLSKGMKLAAVLDRLGENADRKRVEAKNDDLGERAAKLRRKIQKDWTAQAKATLEGIRSVNTKLQTQIRSIERTEEAAGKVVRALGYIDDLIDIAKTVAKAIA